MNFRTPPKTPLLSWMVIASLAVLGTDTAWSEATRNPQNKKTQAKKSKPVSKKVTKAARPVTPTAASHANAAAPALATTALPAAAAISALPLVQAPAAAPSQAPAAAQVPVQVPAQPPVQSGAQAAETPRTAPHPAQPAASQVQPGTNPYITVPQPNPWTVQVNRGPAQVNPYLAYRYAPPALAASPVPWGIFPAQQPAATAPSWLNPFAAFQPTFLPPAGPMAAAPLASAPRPGAPAWINPYLAYQAPVIAATPWTAPAFKAPTFQAPAFQAPFIPTPQFQPPQLPAWPAPAQASPPASQPTPWTAPVPASAPTWNGNPYLAYRAVPVMPPLAAPAAPAPSVASAPVQSLSQGPLQAQLPSPPVTLQSTPWGAPPPVAKAAPEPKAESGISLGGIWDSVKYALLPGMPPSDQAILPTIKTVYPTGEKPLKVLTFKCPTELIGVTPLPTKALHELVNVAMDGINSTDLLPFNMQQVCQ